MRKQTKIVALAAVLALGASFTSMAAAKTGEWKLEDDGWYCYDNNGDAYEDEFCLSYGKEYYVGSDGLLVTSSWVEADGKYYYVGSDGQKTINDWRFVAPEDDDEADEEWFLFDTKGRMVTGKKVYEDKTYYFDENGKMLTGWVTYADGKAEVADKDDKTATLVYCDETGARMSEAWVNTFVPGTAEEDQADATLYWYWIKSKGGVQTGRNLDIDGRTYFFAEDGRMLTGWVAATDSNADSKLEYVSLGYEKSAEKISKYTQGVYFCGSSDQGWAKTDRWVKTWAPADYYEADADVTQNWYYIAKSGKVYVPVSGSASNAKKMTFVDGSAVLDGGAFAVATDGATQATLKEIDKKTYAFNNDGEMLSGLVKVSKNEEMKQGMYYFGGADDGSMKTGSVVIEDNEGVNYDFYFGKKNTATGYNLGVGVTGAISGELYKEGLIVTASADEEYKEVELWKGYFFIVDEDGDIRTSKKQYKNEDDKVFLDTEKTTFETKDGIEKGSYRKSAVK